MKIFPKFTLKKTSFLYWILKARYKTRLNVSDGNKKLVSNDDVRFIVWNLPAIKTCPFATEHCRKSCYAVKAERAYKYTLPCRLRNFEESKKDDFADHMIYTILDVIRHDRRDRKYIVRIHESGDFYNERYASAWLKIAETLKGENIVFIAYTKSFPYFDGKHLPNNFRLRASVWDDTSPEALETIKRNEWMIYTAVDKFRKGDKFHRCRCKDCATCGWCWSKRKDIRVEIH